jgi:hypothetical protein
MAVKSLCALACMVVLILISLAPHSFAQQQDLTRLILHSPIPRSAPLASTAGAFAFVSNFESGVIQGWSVVEGKQPIVVDSPNYFGEPSLESSATGRSPQVDEATQGFITGDNFISLQVAIYTKSGSGFFGLFGSNGPVAVVGVEDGYVVAGSSPSSVVRVEPIPVGTVYPSGWVYIAANVYNASTPSSPNAGWVMQLFVDRTDQPTANISVPQAGGYRGAIIYTESSTVYYTNIVVTTYEIPIYLPGYNNMMGYGQGSGLLVNLLPAFYNLSALMVLKSWSTPQQGILSFQINAMNYYGTTRSTCVGFFQLGVDLDPNGTIAPWYVPGKNCFAHYFISSQNPAVQPGVPTPMGTVLTLSIVYEEGQGVIVFTIHDLNTSTTYTASIPYNGTPFYGAYTQLEFQPCCNLYPISQYMVDGELQQMQIVTLTGQRMLLPASYMLPFTLDTPPTWSFTYYDTQQAGYQQISS